MATATNRVSEQAVENKAIRPFQVNVSEAELAELGRRILAGTGDGHGCIARSTAGYDSGAGTLLGG
jgi:hypothetical protein